MVGCQQRQHPKGILLAIKPARKGPPLTRARETWDCLLVQSFWRLHELHVSNTLIAVDETAGKGWSWATGIFVLRSMPWDSWLRTTDGWWLLRIKNMRFVLGNLGSQTWLDPWIHVMDCQTVWTHNLFLMSFFWGWAILSLACLATLFESRPLPSQNGVNIPTNDYSGIATFPCEAGLQPKALGTEMKYISCFLFFFFPGIICRILKMLPRMHELDLIQANQVKETRQISWQHSPGVKTHSWQVDAELCHVALFFSGTVPMLVSLVLFAEVHAASLNMSG